MSNNSVTVDDLETFMESKRVSYDFSRLPFNIPKEFVTIYGNNKARDYISQYQLEDTEARLMYDVKQDRIVFLIEENGEVVGAVGRALAEDIVPKWYKYNSCHLPFVAGTNKYIGVVVEDCVSACKVALANLTGIAIMGTSLKEEYVSPIASIIERCFVCSFISESVTCEISRDICVALDLARAILLVRTTGQLSYLSSLSSHIVHRRP